jgi:hypothetical protein
MPSRSQSEHRYWEMIAHDKDKAKQEGVSQSVAREFVEGDKHNKDYKKRDHVAKKADYSPEIENLLKKI